MPESSPSGKDAEKEQGPAESSSPAPGVSADTAVKDADEPLENKTSAEKGETSGADDKQETEGKEAASVEEGGGDIGIKRAVAEGGGDVEIKPAVAEQSEESIKDETIQDPEVPKQAEMEPQDVKEESVPVESAPQEKNKQSAEEPRDEHSKEGTKRVHAEPSEEETSQQPSPKKKKSAGIFGGFFARRKSRKSIKGGAKDGSASPPAEKAEGDKVEEPQDASATTQPTGGVTETLENSLADQGEVPDAAATKEQEDAVAPQQEVTEGMISVAVDQTLESVKEEVADKDKTDAAIGGQEAKTIVTEKPEVESALPEDVQVESTEETLASKEASDTSDKAGKETAEPCCGSR